jgi:hypothetical protein
MKLETISMPAEYYQNLHKSLRHLKMAGNAQVLINRVIGKVPLSQKRANPSFRFTDYMSTEVRFVNPSALIGSYVATQIFRERDP